MLGERFQLRGGRIEEHHIQTLTLPSNHPLISFETWNTDYGRDVEVVQKVCAALTPVITLGEFMIGNVYFTGPQIQCLVDLFKNNRNIVSVMLPYIESNSDALAESLAKNEVSLEKLTLSYSVFTAQNVLHVVKSLRTNATVKTLSVSACNLSNGFYEEIDSLLDDNTTLEQVNTFGIPTQYRESIQRKLNRNKEFNVLRQSTLFDRLYLEHVIEDSALKRQRCR